MKKMLMNLLIFIHFTFFMFCSSPSAIYKRANSYYENGEYEKALALKLDLAQKGFADAQLDVGLAYLDGKGLEKNEKLSFHWIKKSTEQIGWHDYGKALYMLGNLYESGTGILKSDEEAIKLFKKAGVNDYAEAYHHLGKKYLNNNIRDYINSPKTWFRLGASLGHKESAVEYNSMCLSSFFSYAPNKTTRDDFMNDGWNV